MNYWICRAAAIAVDPKERADVALRHAIETIATEIPAYGSRRIMQQLRRSAYQLVVNRKTRAEGLPTV